MLFNGCNNRAAHCGGDCNLCLKGGPLNPLEIFLVIEIRVKYLFGVRLICSLNESYVVLVHSRWDVMLIVSFDL